MEEEEGGAVWRKGRSWTVGRDNKDDNVHDEEDNGWRKDGQRSAG